MVELENTTQNEEASQLRAGGRRKETGEDEVAESPTTLIWYYCYISSTLQSTLIYYDYQNIIITLILL